MKSCSFNFFFILAGLMITFANALAADGQVLVVAGDLFAVRAGKEIRLERNSGVQSGDTLRTAAGSNAQIRFSDGSIVALRPQTVFRVDEYKFSGKDDGNERGFFSLIKGGFRTITGWIGKGKRDNYQVKAVTATIGIRGTYFNLVLCQQDCLRKDGSTEKNGLYGGVSDGRIAVSNKAGDKEFGKDQYFYVSDINTLAQPLIAPPDFLLDRLVGQLKSKKGGGDNSQTAQTAINMEVPSTAELPTTIVGSPTQFQVTENKDALGDAALLPAVTTTTIAGDGVFPTSGTQGAYVDAFSFNTLPGGTNSSIYSELFYYYPMITIYDAQGLVRVDYVGGGTYDARGNASVYDAGADGGVITWGRWSNGTVDLTGIGSTTFAGKNEGYGYIAGLPTQLYQLPTNGIVTFNLLGATTPTFSDGVGAGLGTGTITSGTATVDFTNWSVTSNAVAQFTGSSGVNTYNIAMTNGSYCGECTDVSVYGTGTTSLTSGSLNVCGNGSRCSTQFSGFFAGAGATHLGLGYDVSAQGFNINGVTVYKR